MPSKSVADGLERARLKTPIANAAGGSYVELMKLAEIEHAVLALPDRDRAWLAARLPDTLPPPGTDVSDQEVAQREREMASGEVSAISHEEFVRRVQQHRGR
jgi:lipocalin